MKTRDDVIIEIEKEIYLMEEEDRIFHEIYGECQYDLCSQIKTAGAIILALQNKEG